MTLKSIQELRGASISEDDTFETADYLGRKPFAMRIERLLSQTRSPLTLALDEPWGSGKTHFLKLLRNLLQQEGYPVIYVSAFEREWSSDPLSLLISDVLALEAELFPDEKTRSKLLETAGVVVKRVALTSAVVATKTATAGLMDLTDATGAEAALASSGDLLSKALEEQLEQQAQQKRDFDNFRTQLTHLAGRKRRGFQQSKPIIFIIDELDRCRPNHTIDFIETIKLLFEVERTHFILGLSIDQTSSALKAVYGPDCDGRLYMEKFFDFFLKFPDKRDNKFNLPESLHELLKTMWKSDKYLSQRTEISEQGLNVLRTLVSLKSMTIRDAEKILSQLSLALQMRPRDFPDHLSIVVPLIYFKLKAPHLFDLAKSGSITGHHIYKEMNYDENTSHNDFETKNHASYRQQIEDIIEYWRELLDAEIDKIDDISRLRPSGMWFNNGRELVQYIALNVVDGFWTSAER